MSSSTIGIGFLLYLLASSGIVLRVMLQEYEQVMGGREDASFSQLDMVQLILRVQTRLRANVLLASFLFPYILLLQFFDSL